MADEKKNTGPEQEAEQGTIPGMEEKADPTETVIDLAAARKAAAEFSPGLHPRTG